MTEMDLSERDLTLTRSSGVDHDFHDSDIRLSAISYRVLNNAVISVIERIRTVL
jgi:hypothetical protein